MDSLTNVLRISLIKQGRCGGVWKDWKALRVGSLVDPFAKGMVVGHDCVLQVGNSMSILVEGVGNVRRLKRYIKCNDGRKARQMIFEIGGASKE